MLCSVIAPCRMHFSIGDDSCGIRNIRTTIQRDLATYLEAVTYKVVIRVLYVRIYVVRMLYNIYIYMHVACGRLWIITAAQLET